MCVDEITRPNFTQPSLINKNGKGGMKLEHIKSPQDLPKNGKVWPEKKITLQSSSSTGPKSHNMTMVHATKSFRVLLYRVLWPFDQWPTLTSKSKRSWKKVIKSIRPSQSNEKIVIFFGLDSLKGTWSQSFDFDLQYLQSRSVTMFGKHFCRIH